MISRPVVSPSDAELFCDIIASSEWKNECTIGLRSSLRKTNKSSDFTCLLISTKIKPFFISWQIIHSVAVREKVPKVFCFPNLEDLALKTSKKKSSAILVPPSAAKGIQSWLATQQQLHPIPRNLLPKENISSVKIGKEKEFTPAIDIQDFYVRSSEDRFLVPTIIKRKNHLSLKKFDKGWSGDFISFGDVEMKDADRIDSEEEKDTLQSMLSKFSAKDKTTHVRTIEAFPKVKTDKTVKKSKKTTEADDSFLEDYLGVTVQKIRKNPDKVKKKKKKKSKA